MCLLPSPYHRATPFSIFSYWGVGGIPPRPSRSEVPPPAHSEQKPAKKFSFPFRRKKSGARKRKNVKKTFLLAGER